MAHCVVPAAEAALDVEFPVLDKGFVRLVDYLGGDPRVAQAARVSYGAGTKSPQEDAGLIDYLLRNRHTSPFEQVVLTFHVKMPIFVARQWVRHRTARLNEISGRYSTLGEECYLPGPEDVAPQSTVNKQGRSGETFSPETAEQIRQALAEGQKQAYQAYRGLLEQGVARELARISLPLSVYTEMYWQIDLHNLFHFLELRLHPHAQTEIRRYAEVLLDLVRRVAPLSAESFERHILGGVSLSREEAGEIRRRLGQEPGTPLGGKDLSRLAEKLEVSLETKSEN